MSPERQTRRVDALRNRDALLAAAQRLFDERGPGVPLDDVAKAAGVANATLYRHFPTRAELIVAAYGGEVASLAALSERLADRADPGEAVAEWLRAFVRHVATKRDLAMAVPDGSRGALFDEWHATMHAAADHLLTRARQAHAVRPDLATADLLALANGIALTGLPPARLDTLLDLIRDGYRAPVPSRRGARGRR